MDLFKSLVWDNLVSLALKRLFLAVPWLGWGPLGFIVSIIVTKIADQLYGAVKEFIAVESIALKNAEYRDAYEKAAVQLRILAHDKGIQSPDFRKARDAHKQALSDFGRFGVARG